MAHETPSDRGGDHDSNSLTDLSNASPAARVDASVLTPQDVLTPDDYDADQRAHLWDRVGLDTPPAWTGAPSEYEIHVTCRKYDTTYPLAGTVVRTADASIDPNGATDSVCAIYTDAQPAHGCYWSTDAAGAVHDATTKQYGWWFKEGVTLTVRRRDPTQEADQ